MRLLKLFLYIILSICLLWAFAILAGPRVILAILDYNYGEKIAFSEITVTPQLEIKFDKVLYNKLQIGRHEVQKGMTRSVSLRVRNLINLAPFIELKTGPTKFEDGIFIESLSLKLQPVSGRLLGDYDIEANLKNFSGKAPIIFEKLLVAGIYSYDTSSIDNLSLSADNLVGYSVLGPNNGVSIGSVSGSLDTVFLASPIFDQQSKMILSFQDIYSKDMKLSIERASSELYLEKQNLSAIAKVKNIGYSESIIADELVLDAQIPTDHFGEEIFIDYQVDSLILPVSKNYSQGGTIENLFGTIKRKRGGNFDSTFSGMLQNLELLFDGAFMANLSETFFKISSASSISKENQRIRLSLETSFGSEISLVGDSRIELDKGDNIFCLFGDKKCKSFINSSSYKVVAGDYNLVGNIYCPNLGCVSSQSSHSISTDNTAMFFSHVGGLNRVNPIFLGALYSQIASGKKIKNGHQLNF